MLWGLELHDARENGLNKEAVKPEKPFACYRSGRACDHKMLCDLGKDAPSTRTASMTSPASTTEGSGKFPELSGLFRPALV
jgi:hypothetical protein